MLAQLFFARYPTGNLISELVKIYQGKFVVRVAVQIDGITRVTGMAAAEAVERAEDQARDRALLVLELQPPAATSVEPSMLQFADTESKVEPEPEAQLGLFNSDSQQAAQATISPNYAATRLSLDLPATVADDDIPDIQSTSKTSQEPWSNVTQLRSRNSVKVETEADADQHTPIDLSDALLKIDVFLKRLGWSADHEAEYLERTYKKRSRQFLTETEVIEFQNYLELLAKTGDEMKRLKWSVQKGRDYLLQTYNKRKRTSLTHQELLEFLQYLESQPSPQESIP